MQKKSDVLEQDSLRCTGLRWFMMRHKEISSGISYVIHLHHGYESKAKAFQGSIFVNMIQKNVATLNSYYVFNIKKARIQILVFFIRAKLESDLSIRLGLFSTLLSSSESHLSYCDIS